MSKSCSTQANQSTSSLLKLVRISVTWTWCFVLLAAVTIVCCGPSERLPHQPKNAWKPTHACSTRFSSRWICIWCICFPILVLAMFRNRFYLISACTLLKVGQTRHPCPFTTAPCVLFLCLGVIHRFCICPKLLRNMIWGVKTASGRCNCPGLKLALSWVIQHEHNILAYQESGLNIVSWFSMFGRHNKVIFAKNITGSLFKSNVVSSYFWIFAHSAVHSFCSSEMILCDVSSSLRVHRSSAAKGERYPFTTSLWDEVNNNRERVNKYALLLCDSRKAKKIRAFGRTSLPSEPPEENLWQEGSIPNGTRILQQIGEHTHFCFLFSLANRAPPKTLSRHGSAKAVIWVLNGACVS